MSVSTFDVVDFFSKAGIGIITGAVAALIAAKVALNRFYHEKWWEKKHSAYNELVDLLIEMKRIYSEASDHYHKVYVAEQSLSEIPDSAFDWSTFAELYIRLHRAYILAPVSLSQKTNVALEKFFRVDAQSDFAIYETGYPKQVAYSEMADEVESLIGKVVSDASNELKFK